MAIDLSAINSYFKEKLDIHGATPHGVDWNSTQAQEARFFQLTRWIDPAGPISLLDYGCGFGALYGYLKMKGWDLKYIGFDMLEDMVGRARRIYEGDDHCSFTSRVEDIIEVDYGIACGIFNLKLEFSDETWTQYVVDNLQKIHNLSRKGFAVNFLTKYSDPEYMKPHLYYPDPCFYFDYCKRHFSRNVALLHDYELYDFTIIVRK